MKIPNSINWNGFLERIVAPDRSNQESCAWIFADVKNDVWNVLEVKNVGLKDKSLKMSFAPDKKDFARVKRLARKNELTKLGNVHTHVVIGKPGDEDTHDKLENQFRPSSVDLKYARKFNDIVRGIIVVWFRDYRRKGMIYGIVWHDQYGKILERKRI